MNGPSDAAVEALAKHLYEVKYAHSRTAMTSWSGLDKFAREYEFDRARVALSKVLPIIREELAQEIETEAEAKPESSPYLRRAGLYSAGLLNAARIVRGRG